MAPLSICIVLFYILVPLLLFIAYVYHKYKNNNKTKYVVQRIYSFLLLDYKK